jgi:hypothetical protein
MNPPIEIDLQRDSDDDISAKLDMLRTRAKKRQQKQFTRAEAMAKLGMGVTLVKNLPVVLTPEGQPTSFRPERRGPGDKVDACGVRCSHQTRIATTSQSSDGIFPLDACTRSQVGL